MLTFPFEVSLEEILRDPESYVDSVFSCLESEFLVMPRGAGFVEYPVFERGYEALKAATGGFSMFDPDKVYPMTVSEPISIVVLRSMLGFTPPEWGYVTTQRTGVQVTQGFVRSLDRKVRMSPETELNPNGVTKERLEAMVQTACQLLSAGAPEVDNDQLHRLNKADTKQGVDSIKNLSRIGAPYAMLLYERFLGRPFAGHRDSVSELIGDSLESAIEDVLTEAGISFRKTKRAERIEGFDQTPDFIIPSEFNPQIIIEAKITEDDGTARDKVTRIQHLGELSLAGRSGDNPKYEVIACIGGRGFGVRREDMKKMILATRGKVFTAKTLDRLVECTRLREFKANQ
ncbi:MAG: C15orf41 family protein [Proteobacteria bacterium]|nr:C15orf41 family protein [Pseudomonadota bacterium]